MAKSIRISPNLALPMDVVTWTQVILAKKGAGKTYTAAVEIEEALRQQQQVVVIDPTGAWWGLKSSADGEHPGFSVAVFGGEHADIPLESSAGEIVAKAIVEQQFSAVIDLSLFRKAEMQRFLSAFFETLYRINRHSLLLAVDEADVAAPQKPFGDEARTLGAMQDIVRRGRIRGLGCILITQRPQVLNKDVLTQADVLVALRLNHPRDLAAIEEWVNVHSEPAKAKEMMESLPSLPIGTAWFWAPALDLLQKTQVRLRTTFDSSATPKPGERLKAPKALATVDIQKLGAEIAQTVQRAQENSPTELKAKIRELEKSLAKVTAAPPPAPVDQSVVRANAALRSKLSSARKELSGLQNLIAIVSRLESALAEEVGEADKSSPPPKSLPPPPPPPVRAKTPPNPASLPPAGSSKLKGTALKAAQIAAGYGRRGETIKRSMLAALCGSVDGGSFSARLSEARTAGALTTEGGEVVATPEGIATYAGQFNPPETTEEMLELWRPKLGKLPLQIIEKLIELDGAAISRTKLAEDLGVAYGGSFSARLSEVRSTGLLIDVGSGQVAANSEALFLGGR